MDKWWNSLPEMTPDEILQWDKHYNEVNPNYRDEDTINTFDKLYQIYKPLITINKINLKCAKKINLARSKSSLHFRIYWTLKQNKYIVLDELDLYGDVSYNWDYYNKIDDDDELVTFPDILPEQLVRLTLLWTRDTLILIRKSEIFTDYEKLKNNAKWLANFNLKYLPYTEDLIKIGKDLVSS